MNACYEEHRRNRRWSTHVRALPEEDPGGPDETISVAERDQIERAFRKLSPEHRAVFVLHHHVGMPMAKVADVVGVPLGTAKSRLHYATRLLQGDRR